MNKLTKNYLYTSGYQILCVIIPLVTTPYLTRVLGKTNLGIDSYVLSIVQLCEIIGSLGTSIYGNREIAYVRDDKNRLEKTFWEIFILRSILCFLICSIYLVISFHSQYKIVFLIQTMTVIAYFFDTSWFFIGLEYVKPVTLCNAVIRIASTLGIFLFVRHKNDLLIYVSLYAVCQAMVCLCLLVMSFRRITVKTFRFIRIRRHLRPVVALFMPQAASSIYVLFDKTMLGLLASDISRISLYDKAEVIVKAPTVLSVALTQVLMPRMANEFIAGHMAEVKRLVKHAMEVVLMFFLPVSVGLAIIAPIFVPRYLGIEYADSVKVVWVLSPIILAIGVSSVTGAQFLIACNDTKNLGISYVSSAVFNLVGNYFLIPAFNEIGASITTLIAEILVVLIQFSAMRRRIGSIDFFRLARKKIFAVLVMGIIITPMHLLGNHIYVGLLQIVCGMAVYFLMLTLLKDEVFETGKDYVIHLLQKKEK